MRLLKDDGFGNLGLVEYHEDTIPRYAILSHTWGPDIEEVTFKDLVERTGKNKAGYKKIEFCRKQAASDRLHYFWVDTCCIDKSSSAELSEAINSMFRWYQNAEKCYVYLSDVSSSGHAVNDQSLPVALESAFRKSRWFGRGWTLQELIAPASVEFFSREGQCLGSKRSLEEKIHEITGIVVEALRGIKLMNFKTEERFSWADHRDTKRPEDRAYSLLGIFNVFMPLIYGEGRDNAFARLREEIGKPVKSHVEQLDPLPKPSSTVPFCRDVDFVDRRTLDDRGTLLEHIGQQLMSAASRVALVGIGGAGKSQLAIEYCYRLRERLPDTWVFWIHASNADRIEQGYREIAEQMKIPGRQDLKQNIFELVARRLRDKSKGRWLLVLDSLDDDTLLSTPEADSLKTQSDERDGQIRRSLSAYLPQSEHGAMLITTRTRSVASKLVEPRNVIPVDSMIDDDAIMLLNKILETPAEGGDLRVLACALEYMPLAIVQAVAYIQQKGPRYSVRQYIEAFQRSERQKTNLLDYEAGHLRRDLEAKNSIIITWQISFDDIRQRWPASADLLSLMSYFDRQGIPEDVLKVQLPEDKMRLLISQKGDNGVSDVDKDKDKDDNIEDGAASDASGDDIFEEAMERLRSYSFITIGENRRTFEMHGLVQLATRKWLKMHGEDERWKRQFCMKLNAVLPTGDHANWRLCEMLFPHAKSAERQPPIEDESVQEWAQILQKAGRYALKRGHYGEAERMCRKSAGALRKIHGGDHVQTLSSLGLLGIVHQHQGRWTEAEKIEVQMTETRKRVLGDEHPDTLTSIGNLAITYQYQGRWIEAEKIFMQVIETSRRVLGDEHPNTLTSISNLASTYRDQGRWVEAEKIEVQVMETSQKVLGEEHLDTLTSMADLATTYWNQGRWTDAEKMFMQVMEMKRRVLGDGHPDTLSSMGNLASTYGMQGRWTKAEKIFMQVMETSRRVLGEEHPSTLVSISNLASIYGRHGRWMEAEEMEVQVIEARKRLLGDEHPSTLASIASLASTYVNQGRWTEAEKIEVQVMETRKRLLGEAHPDTLTSMAELSSTYRAQGRWVEAEKMAVQVVEMRKRLLGDEHPDTLISMTNLAATYRKQGHWTKAETIEVQVLGISRRVLGEEHPDTLASISNLAALHQDQGRWTEAEKMEVQVMEITKRLLGDKHPSTLTSISNLATTYRDQGRYTEAEKMEVEVIEARKRLLGDEHPDTLSSMANLASIYWKQERWKEAEKMFIQVMETEQKVLGEGHPDTLVSISNLASTYRQQGQWTQAEKMEVQVMETSKKLLGDEHPDTLSSMANLASTYCHQERWTEAEKLFAQVVETSQRVLGDDHPDTLTRIGNLATTYCNQGRYVEAEKMEVQTMETRKRIMGDEHPDTLTCITNLASTYRNQRRWTEAEKLFMQVIETRKRILGDEHPDTLTSISHLGSTYWHQGRPTDAEKMEVQVMETRKRLLGDEHPDTLSCFSNLAALYRDQGRWTEAEKMEVQVMETRKKLLGDEHPDTLTSIDNLALTVRLAEFCNDLGFKTDRPRQTQGSLWRKIWRGARRMGPRN